MTDYQTLYNQSQALIQKQKDQIKKLEEEIRERCQSYLIHSSRYRSKESSSKKSADGGDQDLDGSRLKLISRTVNTILDVPEELNGVPKSEIADMRSDELSQANSSITSTPNKLLNSMPAEQIVEVPMSPIGLIETNTETPTKSEGSSSAIQQQSSNNETNWEEVSNGLKERLSEALRQKSEQTRRVHELEDELKKIKKENKILDQSSMKKKPKEYALEKSESLDKTVNGINGNTEIKSEKQFESLWNAVGDEIDIHECGTVQERVALIVSYIQKLRKENISNGESQGLSESKVESYNNDTFSTPYRKNKNGAEANVLKDTYEADEIEHLKKKCKELEAELTLSRVNKDPISPEENEEVDNEEEEEIINDPPFLVEEEIEKPNSAYVKRTFVRKKVVKRNLSAMILKCSSKSKKQSKENMQNQLENLKNHLQKSKDGKNDKNINSLNRKILRLEQSLKATESQIDELSDESSVRASGVSDQDHFTEIIQVETQGPGYKNYTAHILGLQKKEQSSHEGKKN